MASMIFTVRSIDITPINIDIQSLHLMEVFKAVINKLFFPPPERTDWNRRCS